MVWVSDYRSKGPSSSHDQTFTHSEESRQLSATPGVGTTRHCHIERKDQTALDKHGFSV